jgi:hypothetical protein
MYKDTLCYEKVAHPVLGRYPFLRLARHQLPILSLLLAPFFSNVTNTSFLADDLLCRTGLKVSADASRFRCRIKEAVLADTLGRLVL